MPFLVSLALLAQPSVVDFDVDGKTRSAWIVMPEKTVAKPPVVFYFHGHGGSGRNVLRSVAVHRAWPEAIVVYGNGLPTKTPRDPEGLRSGWDMNGGEENRDLRFFDAMLDRLTKEYRADAARVFVGGHSNGGGFTYYLWQHRADKIAAFAPSAAAGAGRVRTAKPAFIVMGLTDETVDPKRQQAAIDTVLKLNEAKTPGTKEGLVTTYAGKVRTATYIYPGGHAFAKESVAPMVKFFQATVR